MSHYSLAVIVPNGVELEDTLLTFYEGNCNNFVDITKELEHEYKNEKMKCIAFPNGTYKSITDSQYRKEITKSE